MKLYFENEKNLKQLSDELDGWIGTPYRHYCCVKGRGVDCALFLGKVFFNIGILSDLKYNYYSKDWHKHSNINIFLNNFEYNIKHHLKKGLKIERVECSINPILGGDWLMFEINSNHINHSALYLGDGKIIHAMQERGVFIDKLKTWKPFMRRSYRLWE